MNLLLEAAIYLGAAIVAVPLFRRLGFGAVLGYMAAGIVIGPWGMQLIGEVESVMHIAEIGVVFLLFVIGLELKPSRLWVMRHAIFGTGFAQLMTAALPIAGIAYAFGLGWGQALLIGFGLGMSSTAFVLQALGERQQLTAPHGRSAFGVLLFQDLAVIPLLALVPLLGSESVDAEQHHFWQQALQALAVMLALVIGGRYLLRPIFRAVARWGSEETFTVAALLVVIGAALLMEWAELSMGLGAFLAGVLLADSEYRHELESNINPFKGLLLGLFFISVGMSLDFGVLQNDLLAVLAMTGLLVGIKVSSLWLVTLFLRLPHPTGIRLALTLAQGGEFAFVLFSAAVGSEVLPQAVVDRLIAVVTLSMALTPLLLLISDWLGRKSEPAAAPAFDTIDPDETPVIIAGFGRVGQVVARVLQMRGILFTALERDVEHVALVRKWGNKIYYGEPTNLETLRAAQADKARILVICMDDVEKSIQAVELARRHFPHLKIYARARDRHHALHLMELGVDYLIRETWESSLVMAREVLTGLGDNPESASYTVEVFNETDQELLKRQLKHRNDLERMIQTSREIRNELQDLFENDPRMSTLKTVGKPPGQS